MADTEYIKFIESLKSTDIIHITNESKQYAIMNGLVFYETNKGLVTTSLIPHTLFPTPFSASIMQQARDLQEAINILIYVISKDDEFIESSLAGAEKNDSFTFGLLNILRACKSQQYPQLATAAILRTDYMVDQSSNSKENETPILKQIEINTISAAYGAHSECITNLHRNTLYNLLQHTISHQQSSCISKYLECIPSNDTINGIVQCIRNCWILYNEKKEIKGLLPAIIFAVQSDEKNKFDQLKIYYLLRDTFITETSQAVPPIFILTLEEMVEKLELDKKLGSLMLKSTDKSFNHEVGVVYFRSCYGPQDFSHDKVWTMRTNVEMSRAIKLPNIAIHLVGSKKFQQILACNHSLVEEFLNRAINYCPKLANVKLDDIISTFAVFYSLDPSDVDVIEVARLVKKHIDNFVLKPQREGGGNNLYGKEMIGAINEKLKNGSLSDYIVMSLIHPKVYSNYKIVDDCEKPVQFKSITELGIFGHFIVDNNNELISNNVDGHLLRTKSVKTKDGGVSSGNAVLDSPILF